jgi:peptidoglycan hydrolase CwlO-like protein
MKYQLNKIFKITFITLFFLISKSYAIENVSEFTDAINEAREEFNEITEATTEQSKIIDEAIKEIDKATEYVQEAINSGNAEDAIKTLEFIEKSLSDVEKIIPQEFSSDMTNIDTSSIAKEDMDTITEMTTQMGVAKEEKDNEFMSDLVDLNLKGIDTVSISENLNGLGVKTIELVLDVEGAENLEKWTKQQWADSYKGDILTSVGDETITDKDINSKVVDLEQQLQTNNAAILEKRTSLSQLQTKIDPLSNEITDLQTQKSSLLAKYNEEILKQSSTILSDEEIGQSKELADQLNNQLGNITNEIKAAEEQSNSLQQQVQSLNLELNNEIASKTQLENNIRDLSNQLSANQNVLSQKTSEINKLKIQI